MLPPLIRLAPTVSTVSRPPINSTTTRTAGTTGHQPLPNNPNPVTVEEVPSSDLAGAMTATWLHILQVYKYAKDSPDLTNAQLEATENLLLLLTAAIRPAVYNRGEDMTRENASRLLGLEALWRDEMRSALLENAGMTPQETRFYDLMVLQSKALNLAEIGVIKPEYVQRAKNLAENIFSGQNAQYLSELEWPEDVLTPLLADLVID